MGILRKMRAIFHEDWCNLCQSEMDVMHKQLYALPDITVGHYSSHEEPSYYREHLVSVEKKAQIPAGMYACGLHYYRCPQCGHRRTKLTIFLPVREEEKVEEILFFDNGELDGMMQQQNARTPQRDFGHRQDSSDRKTCGPYGYE